jgi:diacylglycerol kinase (ATP)
MKSAESLTFTGRIRSFRCAFKGIGVMISSQHNAWIHAVATVIVMMVGFYLHLATAEWCWIILAIVSVWTAKALNIDRNGDIWPLCPKAP